MNTLIKIVKGAKPQILKEHAQQWTADYLTALEKIGSAPDSIKNRYQNPEIKAALITETHGKCAYCESKIKAVSYGDIEHILPKNKNARPDLFAEWTNLTLACEICNRTNKKNYYNPDDPLINPIEDDPSDFLIAFGPFFCQSPGQRKGALTIKILDLNRTDLVERRKEKIEKLLPLIDLWKNETNATYKALLFSQIKQESEANSEYSFTINTYLECIGFYE